MAPKSIVRWSSLDNQGLAQQFNERGTERKSRNGMSRFFFVFCDKLIANGARYLDVNGFKHAHKACIDANSATPVKQPKVITHKMVEELSAKKAAVAKTVKASRRGRPSKRIAEAAKPSLSPTASVAAAKTSSKLAPARRGRKPKAQQPVAEPAINLSAVREALPGAIVTLTITGTVEAVQRALDKLQN